MDVAINGNLSYYRGKDMDTDKDPTRKLFDIKSMYIEEDDGYVTLYMTTKVKDDCVWVVMTSKEWKEVMKNSYLDKHLRTKWRKAKWEIRRWWNSLVG